MARSRPSSTKGDFLFPLATEYFTNMRILTCTLLALFVIGCSETTKPKEDIYPVAGTIHYRGAPLADATIAFFPAGETRGFSGAGRSDKNGRYFLVDMHGNKGMVAGEYTVTISRRVLPGGQVVPADDKTPPIESLASESLPPQYSKAEMSQLTTIVTKAANTCDFDLK